MRSTLTALTHRQLTNSCTPGCCAHLSMLVQCSTVHLFACIDCSMCVTADHVSIKPKAGAQMSIQFHVESGTQSTHVTKWQTQTRWVSDFEQASNRRLCCLTSKIRHSVTSCVQALIKPKPGAQTTQVTKKHTKKVVKWHVGQQPWQLRTTQPCLSWCRSDGSFELELLSQMSEPASLELVLWLIPMLGCGNVGCDTTGGFLNFSLHFLTLAEFTLVRS